MFKNKTELNRFLTAAGTECLKLRGWEETEPSGKIRRFKKDGYIHVSVANAIVYEILSDLGETKPTPKYKFPKGFLDWAKVITQEAGAGRPNAFINCDLTWLYPEESINE